MKNQLDCFCKRILLLAFRRAISGLFGVGIFVCHIGCSDPAKSNLYFNHKKVAETEFKSLFTPTQIEFLNGLFYIVDCWHHRILFSPSLNAPLADWYVLDDENLAGPHSIASDGEYLVVDNTGLNKVNVYKFGADNRFYLIQEIDGVGVRPHRVRFDLATKEFYVLSSNSQEFFALKKDSLTEGLKVARNYELFFLESAYTRSFSFDEYGDLIFLSGPSKVTLASKLEPLVVKEAYDVDPAILSMNDILFFRGYYYVTATNKKIYRTKSLQNLRNISLLEDLYDELSFRGTPYYFSVFQDMILIPEIIEYSGIRRFSLAGDAILGHMPLIDSGTPSEESLQRRALRPL